MAAIGAPALSEQNMRRKPGEPDIRQEIPASTRHRVTDIAVQSPQIGETPAPFASNHGDWLAILTSPDRPALVNEWRRVFGHPAPRSAQVKLLRGILAWHCQVKEDSHGHAKQLIRQLRGWTANAPVANLAVGTQLLREWKGQTHHVTVVEDGFEYHGHTYKSLTAVTRKITGMGWSGPLFFGLRK